MLGTRFSRYVALVVLIAITVLVSGCGGGPAATANKFVSATLAQKYVEASGYLGGGVLSGEGEDGGNTSALLPESAKADFKVSEQSDTTAKVTSAGDSRNYMLLSKMEGNWKITEVCYFVDSVVKEPVRAEAEYKDDPNEWEGIDVETREEKVGESTYKVTNRLQNGQSTETRRNLTAVNTKPVAMEVKRGTKPRSAGWTTLGTEKAGFPFTTRFRVKRVLQRDDTLAITVESQCPEDTHREPKAYLRFYYGGRDIATAKRESSNYDERHQPWEDGEPFSITYVFKTQNIDVSKVMGVVSLFVTEGTGGESPLKKLYPGPFSPNSFQQ